MIGVLTVSLWVCTHLFINVFEFSATELDKISRQIAELSPTAMNFSSQILDRHGDVMAHIGATQRIYTPLNSIPQHTQQAFLAIEDANFYDHSGISLRGIMRALVVNISHQRFVEGGSTITQQIARSLFLNRKKILSRKFKEGIIALALEHKFSKNELLEIYLNHMYFGKGAYGIGAAAQRYFHTTPQQLSLAQSAYLAGLLKAPSRFAAHRELALKRQRQVLNRMLATQMISPATYQRAKAAPIQVMTAHNSTQRAPYFVDTLTYELKRYLHQHSLQTGWVIKSTFDPDWQHKLTHLMAQKWRFLSTQSSSPTLFAQESEIAGVTYDFVHHHILAIKGGKSYRQSQFNRAIYTRRPVNTMIMPALGTLLIAKNPVTYSTALLQHHIRSQNLLAVATQMEKYGSTILKKLIKQTGHQPKYDGYELILGYEAFSPLTLARLMSLLITSPNQFLPRPTTIQTITYGHHHRTTPNQALYTSRSNQPPSSYIKLANLAQLVNSWGCLLSYSSYSTDNIWSIYISASTITVIWLGTERGKIRLPHLNIPKHQQYEALGQSLVPPNCSPQRPESLQAPVQTQPVTLSQRLSMK